MRVERIVGRLWSIEAETEKNQPLWVTAVADTPEQALASFRDQYPGHSVRSCTVLMAGAVIVPS